VGLLQIMLGLWESLDRNGADAFSYYALPVWMSTFKRGFNLLNLIDARLLNIERTSSQLAFS